MPLGPKVQARGISAGLPPAARIQRRGCCATGAGGRAAASCAPSGAPGAEEAGRGTSKLTVRQKGAPSRAVPVGTPASRSASWCRSSPALRDRKHSSIHASICSPVAISAVSLSLSLTHAARLACSHTAEPRTVLPRQVADTGAGTTASRAFDCGTEHTRALLQSCSRPLLRAQRCALKSPPSRRRKTECKADKGGTPAWCNATGEVGFSIWLYPPVFGCIHAKSAPHFPARSPPSLAMVMTSSRRPPSSTRLQLDSSRDTRPPKPP